MTEEKIDWQSYKSLTENCSFVIDRPRKPIGWWVMPGGSGTWVTKFGGYKKPNALVRFSMQYVFGWKWEDVEKEKT
jgi:hypothetical protein